MLNLAVTVGNLHIVYFVKAAIAVFAGRRTSIVITIFKTIFAEMIALHVKE